MRQPSVLIAARHRSLKGLLAGQHNMTTIRQLLLDKGNKIHSVGPEDTVYDALRKMADENIGSLVVMEGDKIHGIITERDYARNVIFEGSCIAYDSCPRYYGVQRTICTA